METFKKKILVLAKTYPSPSAKYIETSCVAGISDDGKMHRIYPVPFRLIEQGSQFKKWQWIEARMQKNPKDHRPESHRIFVDTIECDEDTLSTKNNWEARWEWIEKIPTFTSFYEVEQQRLAGKISLALLKPKKILGLEVKPARNNEWTDEEKAKLLQDQMQGNLFNEIEEERHIKELKKIPFDFYYKYICDTPDGEVESIHKIVDWEAGALYWNCQKRHGLNWEVPFRAKLESEFLEKELLLLMGNQQRFQDQWLIISLIYPPKQKPVLNPQNSLF